MNINRSIRNMRYRLAHHVKRAGQAWRLATGRMTQEDAQDLFHTVSGVAGWHVLQTIAEEGVASCYANRYGEPDEQAKEWIGKACARVAYKWSDVSELTSVAEDWAMDLIREYASSDGVELVEADAELEEA